MSRWRFTDFPDLFFRFFRYNIKVIFANKFVYFLIAAFLFFVFIITVSIIDDANLNEETIYGFLVFPGILLIFYPVVYGLQNDDDSKMLEIIFGIPNYRYKVWLVRFFITMVVVAANLYVLGFLANFALYHIEILPMLLQVLFPVTFLASLAFMFSTLIKSGNGTAIVMVILGILFLIFSEALRYNAWNLFLNPYSQPREMSETIWLSIIFKNRLYMAIGTVLALLYGIFNLQFRERFVG